MSDMDNTATFADVLNLYDQLDIIDGSNGIATTLDDKFDNLKDQVPGCFAITCWNSFRKLPEKTMRCVFGTLNTALDTIFTPELRKVFQLPNKVDFKQIGSERHVLFIVTSAVNTALHSFVNIFYSLAYRELFEFAEKQPDGKLPVPVDMICDDFASGGRMLSFPEYISVFREKDISATILIQSESQLASMYGENDATTIINCCDTYIYLGGMDLQTSKNVSQRANLPLDEVLYMPVGREIIFRRGQKPKITTRYSIMEDERYQEVTRMLEKTPQSGRNR